MSSVANQHTRHRATDDGRLLAATGMSAILGGLAGMRFHRTVDRAGLGGRPA